MLSRQSFSTFGLCLLAASATLAACSSRDATRVSDARDPSDAPAASDPPARDAQRFVLGSISIDADGNRVSYAQIVSTLEGNFDNAQALEAPGNAVFLSHGESFFYGLAESPEWVRYSTVGGFRETGRLSFVGYGISSMDFANVIVDDDTAVSVLTSVAKAIVWSPSRMEITGVIDLPQLVVPGHELEAFTTVAHDGLVYVPGKWVNWDAGDVMQRVSITILDPKSLSVVGVAEDDRCGAGGRVNFDRQGYAYVMGDGRNQSMQVFSAARGEPVVHNCLLRIPPGATDFDPDWFYDIPSLTGGLDSMTELLSASLDDGYAFSMMMYPDLIPAGLDQVNFEHWDVPAYKLWRITLAEPPRAEVVEGANYSVVGFPATGAGGKLYSSESDDGSTSSVYEVDPGTNVARLKFTMDGYFAGLHPLSP